jgi:deoxyribodipyrimidine photolyase-related protein
VMTLVGERYAHHFGDLEPFGWAVTRADALEALEHFISACLPLYGDYQDAMKVGEPFLYHSIISPYLNCGLLTAREVCVAAERAFRAGHSPLNAVEGLIRQILGWREYLRGIYWRHMPDYADTNALDAQRPLPEFFWSGDTRMNCVAQVVGQTRRNAYAHHIQRLMITGNFALLAGLEPRAVEEWYLAVYIDAFDWVELPNTHGMVLFADGGMLASKPYAASGAYINRMSDYCGSCSYDVKEKSGEKACPFNILYWHFLIENHARLAGNPRMAMPYRTLEKMSAERRAQITQEALAFLDGGDKRQGANQFALNL